MEFLLILAIVLVVAVMLVGPLRRSDRSSASGAVAELEAARDAKYRELRDAELDHRTGKLSDADFTELDRTLRVEALAILHRLDRTADHEGD